MRQPLQPGLRHSIKTKLSDTLVEPTTTKIGEIITETSPDCSPDQHLRKAVLAKKAAMREHSRHKERDISLQHDENQNRVEPVLKQQIVEKLEVHEETAMKLRTMKLEQATGG